MYVLSNEKGGLPNVKSECIFSGGHESCEAEEQCRVGSDAGDGETGCSCRGVAREEFHAPKEAPDEMGGVAGGSRGGVVSAIVVAAVFFARAGHAPIEYDAAGCGAAAGGRAAST